MINQKQLLADLTEWFGSINRQNPNFWSRNAPAALIKSKLKEFGYWKDRRGSQAGRSLAYKKMKEHLITPKVTPQPVVGITERSKLDW
jgi:hypothetical protein